MKQRIISLLIAIWILTAIMHPAAAAEIDTINETVYFDDGSYMVVTIQEGIARASNTKTGSKVHLLYE